MLTFTDKLFEGRAEYLTYISKNKAGKATNDSTKITKIEVEIPGNKGIVEHETLSEIAQLVKEQKALTAKLETAKAEVRQYMEDLFDVSDKLNTRVLKINVINEDVTSELVVSMNKDTERKTVDYKGFLEELKTIYAELAIDFDMLLEKYTSIAKVASAIKFDLSEAVTLRGLFRQVMSYFTKRFNKYDRFIKRWG